MKNEILDSPFRDSFSDFLEKGETIVWEDSAIDPKYAVVPVKKNLFNFNRNKILITILAGILLGTYIVFYDELASSGTSFLVIAALLLLNVLNKHHYKNNVAEFALTTKRILIKSNHSKQRVIYEIPFSQLNNCLVEEKNSGRGTIFLALKNPEKVQFETFTIRDNGEIEKRHQPTLENIKNPHAVAKLIKEGIQISTGRVIKNKIIETHFRNPFSDFLEKGEKIIWEDSALDSAYAVTPVKKSRFNFNQNETIIFFSFISFLGIYIFFYNELSSTKATLLVISVFLLLNILYKKFYKNDVAEFALTTKRILIKSNHSKQRVIYEIPFSQLNNCLVDERDSERGTIFLVLKKPEDAQFETFYIRDNGEIEKRHQPTLENIEDPQAVAKLIREGIRNSKEKT